MEAVPSALPIAVTAGAVAAIDYLVRHYIPRPAGMPRRHLHRCSDTNNAIINYIKSEPDGIIGEEYDQPQRRTNILK